MGKKPQQNSWPEAIKLCRLNQNDVEMAKRLGFQPDALIRARPGPNQKWKLPVNQWVRELHQERFGSVLGQKPAPAPVSIEVEPDQETMRRIEEQFYREDYWERNEVDTDQKKREGGQAKSLKARNASAAASEDHSIDDDSVPF